MNRKAVAVIAVCVVLGLVVNGWGYRRQEHTIDQLERQQAELTETRGGVLCPLYEVFLQSDTPERRAAVPPEDRGRYDHAIGVIRAGADTLNCRFLEGSQP